MKMESKIKVTTDPVFGARCAVCGTSGDGQKTFYDLGAFEDFWGAVVLCKNCANELLRVMDYAPVAEVESRNEQIRVLVERVQEVQAENESLRNAVSVLRNLSASDVVADTPADETSEGNEQGSENSESGSTKSSSSRRSKGVSKSATTDFFS